LDDSMIEYEDPLKCFMVF